jgi:multidrug efflux system outer membrane protein
MSPVTTQLRTFALLLAASTSLAACAVGPDFTPPKAAGGTPFIAASFRQVSSAAPVEDHWWKLYNDPVLDSLVADALVSNTDIRVAVAHLEKARAQLGGARSALYPQTTISGSTIDQQIPAYQSFPGFPRRYWSVDGGINLNYEVDLFGRVRRSLEAARGDVRASAADLDAVRVEIIADTVRAYADATASARQIEVAKQTVGLLDKSIHVTGDRVEAGQNERLDLIRITALRDQRQAVVSPLEAERDAALFRLATLTGRAPGDLPSQASLRTTPLNLDQPIPVGDGRSLIARRPDVAEAEQRLAADTARIGVATADLYPRINLTGAVGGTSASLSDAFGAGTFRWLIGPSISWDFPNILATRARIAGARADTKADLATFDGTVLTALRETETALSAYSHEIERHAALLAARDEADRAARASLNRQREGTIDFLTVLDAERTLADSQGDLAASDARIAFDQVDLFKALGGGWSRPTEMATAQK